MRRIDYTKLKQLAEETLPVTEAMITSDMDLHQVDALQGAKSLLKKLEDLVADDAAEKAIDLFFASNDACKSFVLQPTRLYDDLLIEGVKYTLERWLHPGGVPFGLADIARYGGLGSGSNIAARQDDFYTKLFDSPLSMTEKGLHVLYRTAISSNPTWLQAEEAREAAYGSRVVSAGSLTTVPKQFDIMRTVISEATLNMWFQRGIAGCIDEVLLSECGISLTHQPDFNRAMAKSGSIDGVSCTIDLKSASDRNALSCSRSIMPRYFQAWLERTRLTHVRRPDGRVEELHMLSSMGNGYTFSLQTLVFASIVVTCYNLLGIKVVKPRPPRATSQSEYFDFRTKGVPGNFGVFGDDIVVRREAYHYVCHALELFGFVVNADKSFATGDFRESCGEDYWRGHLVRGIYVKNLRNEADCFSAFNRLVRWSTRTQVSVDALCEFLAKQVRFLPIPPRDGDAEGIHCPDEVANVQYYAISSQGSSKLYRALTAIPETTWTVPESDKVVRVCKVPHSFRYNNGGILVALVGGYIRDGRITVARERDRVPRSKVLQRSVPFWDYIPEPDRLGDRGDAWFSVAAEVIRRCFRLE